MLRLCMGASSEPAQPSPARQGGDAARGGEGNAIKEEGKGEGKEKRKEEERRGGMEYAASAECPKITFPLHSKY